jgi:RimJ/RimL family protein N-acetyltransferase
MGSNTFAGKSVRLRAVEPEDWEAQHHWNQQSNLLQGIDHVWLPSSRGLTRSLMEERSKQTGDDDNFRFQIETLAGELVGWLVIHQAQPRTGTFWYGVAVAEEHRRKGYAAEAIVLALRYYFLERRYQKVNADVWEYNAASIALQTRLGFTQEGRLRRMQFTGGQYYDRLIFGMTREEFLQRPDASVPGE